MAVAAIVGFSEFRVLIKGLTCNAIILDVENVSSDELTLLQSTLVRKATPVVAISVGQRHGSAKRKHAVKLGALDGGGVSVEDRRELQALTKELSPMLRHVPSHVTYVAMNRTGP